MSLIGNLSLTTHQGCILNCFGIQPVFVENGKIHESFFATVYRAGTSVYPTGKMQQFNKYRIGEKENEEILKNSFHINDANRTVVNLLLNERTFSFKQNASLDELMKDENHEKLKEIILMHLTRIKYYTMMCIGNFLITSRKDLYYKKLFCAGEIKNFTMYLVDESILPRNIIIMGHSDTNSFRTPYVACPLINKNHFDEICEMNDINLQSFDKINPKSRYPLIEKYLNFYSLYQSYLDNVDVPYWYIETFNNPVKTRQKAYYTTLYFD